MEDKKPVMKIVDKDAIIKLEIGTLVIEQLQQVGSHIVKDITNDQIQKYYEELKSYPKVLSGEKEFSEEWMKHYSSIIFFLNQIEKEAEKQGLVREISLEDYIKEEMEKASSEDSQ